MPRLLHVEHGCVADALVGEPPVPFVARLRGESRLEKFLYGRLCRTPGRAADFHEIGASERVQQILDEIHLRAREHDVLPVRRLVKLIESRAAMEALHGQIGRPVIVQYAAQDVRRPRHEGVDHGDVDVVALAALLAFEQGHQDRDQRGRTQRDIGHGQCRQGRRAPAVAPKTQHAGKCLCAHIVRGPLRKRARLPERGQRAIDDARRPRPDCCVPQPEAAHDAGAERIDDHVALFRELQEDLLALVALEVERHRKLAALGIAEIGGKALYRRPEPARGLALQAFDLDHLRAVIGHREAHPRAGKKAGQVEHADAVELHGPSFRSRLRRAAFQARRR